jgi:hypothetical protein
VTRDRSEIVLRRHARLREFGYRASYAYLVMMCADEQAVHLGPVNGWVIDLAKRGMVARDCWFDIPTHHPHAHTTQASPVQQEGFGL